ncbi:MAG: peptide chain release factor N(5)-glutamine methyltransferase [Terracidiphilus sp.]
MNLREWLDQGEARLCAGPHPERARRDTETLMLHTIGKSKAWLLAHLNDDFAGCVAIRYAGLLDRRHKGEPIQYITGETEFYGLPLRVTRDVLIPRPETEHVVESALRLAAQLAPAQRQTLGAPCLDSETWESNELHPFPRILDIGTGSGAIAIALAHGLPDAQITATDISSSALALAQENAERNAVAIRFLQGDLLLPVAEERFDIIVSNPPYVPASDRDSLSVEVRDHEPALALFAGPDGLNVYRHLIPAAFAALTSGGFLALEIGFGQASPIQELLIASGFHQIEFTPDLQGIPRVVSAQRH